MPLFHRIWLLTVMLSVTLWVAALPAGAQTEQIAARPTGSLDEITVTANRRSKALRNVPSNTSLLSHQDINFIRADHMSEAINRLAGVNIQRGNGQDHLTAIRSPVLTGGAGAGSFLYLENGVPLRAAGFANVNGLFEAHSELAGTIEVVRGPGSALYGSNAVHGLINVLTPTPSDEPDVFVEGLWGSYDRGRLRASASDTIGPHGYFAGVTLLHEAGYREDAGLDQQKVSLRYDYDGGPTRLTANFAGHNLNQETAGFIRGPNAYKDSALARTNPNPEAFRDTKAARVSLRIEHDLDSTTVLSITPYARWNEMDFLMHFLPNKALEENGHKSFGVLSGLYWSFGNGSELVLGTDAEITDGFLKETQSLPGFGSFPQGAHYDYDILAVVAAVYAHGEWQITPKVRLVGGVRYEYTHYDYDNKLTADTIGRFQRPADRKDSFDAVTPKFGVIYDIGPDNTLFANFSMGARAPQTTDLYRLQVNQEIGEIKEEKIKSMETGTRGSVFNITYQLSAFYMKKRHFFFRDADGFNVIDGKTKHWGIELEASIPLSETLDLNASATYARHEYDFTNEVSVNSTESIRKGDDVDTAPRLISNVRLVWQPKRSVLAELEWQHMGEYYTDGANEHDYPGHDLLNVRLRWQANERVEFFANIRNLTNTDYAERADFSFGSERYFPGEQRTYQGGIAVRF